MLNDNHYQKLNLKYNPFSFLNKNELLQVTYERLNLERLSKNIILSDSCFVEFYGNKGLGKSTHLQLLYSKYVKEAKFVLLKKKKKQFIEKTDKILIIDSFQLLTPTNKVYLLNNQSKLIITSHYSHSLFQLKHKNFRAKVNFNKLEFDMNLLKKIVSSKIKLAAIDSEKELPKIKNEHLDYLLNKYKKNIRAIQASLYDAFLTTQKNFYEL
ncbi:hypothetical protein [Tenacibaculum maritimum]|uniref:Chromosomal replication initiator protein DnaA domain-containing protein n=10 Tax=Tenacibaculum maritimum TaxID=107401 RepID=A0A2H1E7Y5_9FLAO|nr:hypothetical protein [Tenacibaculum maritimum]SFZ80929.1 protein of unknown function [Tenacibaculum maritimum NCIMB 2154]